MMLELRYWNLLTRTHHYDQQLGCVTGNFSVNELPAFSFFRWELMFYWVVGVLCRYFILVPMRYIPLCVVHKCISTDICFCRLILATLAVLWLVLSMFLIGVIPFLRLVFSYLFLYNKIYLYDSVSDCIENNSSGRTFVRDCFFEPLHVHCQPLSLCTTSM